MSSSWVYLFSQFTPEALVFEGLLICALAAGYSAFWLLRKRRHGVIRTDVPAGVVKDYLLSLIQEAEFIRMQLFGLLQQGGAPTGMSHRSLGGAVGLANPAALSELEGKLSEQQKALERVINEKIQLEADLAAAKSAAGAGSGGGGGASAELEEKLKSLQARLDEYSIIEDDLANLKRLTQENAALKTQLASVQSGGAAPAPVAAAAAAPAAVAAAVAAPAAVAVAAALAPEEPATPPAPEPAPPMEMPALATATAPANDSPLEMATEGIQTGHEVEQPVAPSLPEPTPAAPAVAAKAEETAALPPEGDLVAEFEKILSG